MGIRVLVALTTAVLAASGARAAAPVGDKLYPVWSPDGKEVAWIAPAPSNWQLWSAHSDGSGARLVATGEAFSEGVDQLDWVAPKVLAFLANYTLYVVMNPARTAPMTNNLRITRVRQSPQQHHPTGRAACLWARGACWSIGVEDFLKGKSSAVGLAAR